MKEQEMQKGVLDATEKSINNILKEGITTSNLDHLYKLVDIHKDICGEMKGEDESMRYRGYSAGGYSGSNYGINYGNYGRERYGAGDNYGNYGRRGYDRKYRGSDSIEDMQENFMAYSEGKEAYSRGNYGAKEDSMKSLEYMLQSMVDFVKMLKDDANSQEELELIKKYTKKISEM